MLAVTVFVFVGWIISVCLHEFGHAVVAYWGGDTSVKDKGYLTLNPLKYTNVSLSLVLPLIFLLLGGIPLPGAAVYINHHSLRNRWWQSAVSAAGPAATALVALILAIPFRLGWAPQVDWLQQGVVQESQWIWYALSFLIVLEIAGVFLNLLPIPSLDGYGIIEPWLPTPMRQRLEVVGRYGLFALFFLLWTVPDANRAFWFVVHVGSNFLGIPTEMAWMGYGLFTQWAGLLLVVMIVAVIIGQRINPSPKTSGQEALTVPQLEKLAVAYEKAAQTRSHDPETWYRHANVLRELQRYEEAIASYDKALDLRPDLAQAWFQKGITLSFLRRYEAAIAAYDQALALVPKSSEILVHQGRAFKQLGKLEEALKTYQLAVEADPNNAAVWYVQGQALQDMQQYEAALDAYDRAVYLQPEFYQVWSQRGIALSYLEKHDRAIASCDKALQLCAQEASVWAAKGVVLIRAHQYEDAIAAYSRAIQLQPDDAFLWYNRACVYALQGDRTSALENLQQAFTLEPDACRGVAQTDTDLDALRQDADFQKLMFESKI